MPTIQAAPEVDIRSASAQTTPGEAKRALLREVALDLEAPVLPDDPFPERVTGRNARAAERLTEWAEETPAKAESLMNRLCELSDEKPVPVRESTRLRLLARAWRVFETFRLLHEARLCPGIFFRLRTKADFLTLSDREADSSATGYDESQRQVLSKRGISHRHIWAEARRLVAVIGLLDDAPDKATAAPASGDGLAAPEAAVGVSVVHALPEGEPEVATPLGDVAVETSGCDLPDVRLDAVWTLLPGLTKAKLAAVTERFGVGLWAQFGDRFYSSMRKAEMLDHTRRVVRHHACLDAAQRLTERQVEDVHDWMRGALGRSPAHSERHQRDEDLRIAARLFSDFQASAALSAAGSGLSPDAWNRYRDAELRRIAAFCYHQFYEDRCVQVASA